MMKKMPIHFLSLVLAVIVLAGCVYGNESDKSPENEKYTPEELAEWGKWSTSDYYHPEGYATWSDDRRTEDLRMELILDSGKNPEDAQFILRMSNTGSRPITIDSQRLNPSVITRYTNRVGWSFHLNPPSLPRPVKKTHMVTLLPGESHDFWSYSADVKTQDLNAGSYTVQCRYVTDTKNYDKFYRKEWDVWRGVVYSDKIYIKKDSKGGVFQIPRPDNWHYKIIFAFFCVIFVCFALKIWRSNGAKYSLRASVSPCEK